MPARESARQHPIGYVHDVVKVGKLFVPTRHHHGNGSEERKAMWDHKIYSLNTDFRLAGRTPDEERGFLERTQKREWNLVAAGALTIGPRFLDRFVIPLAPMHCVRRLVLKGEAANRDLIFKVTVAKVAVPAGTKKEKLTAM